MSNIARIGRTAWPAQTDCPLLQGGWMRSVKGPKAQQGSESSDAAMHATNDAAALRQIAHMRIRQKP